jgi:hypothetical protein
MSFDTIFKVGGIRDLVQADLAAKPKKERKPEAPVERSDVAAALETWTRVQTMKPLTPEDYLRVSNIVNQDFCARAVVLASLNRISLTRTVEIHSAYIMDLGTKIHELVQVYLGELGILIGDWQCSECLTITENTYYPGKCVCDHGNWRYVEKTIESKEYRLRGHYDGLLMPVRKTEGVAGVDRLLEIKTVDAQVFHRMTAPKVPAVHQTQIYMKLRGMPKGHILYAPRGKPKDVALFKGFDVDLDSNIVQPYLDMSKRIFDAITGAGPVPDCACSPMQKNSCQVIRQCVDTAWKRP